MSLHLNEDSYPIYGNVEALSGEVVDAKIKYSQNVNDTNYEGMKEISVRKNGSFSQVVNILPNAPVYFYVIKEGYTTSKYTKILMHTNKENDIGKISMSTLYETLSYEALEDENKAPRLTLYKDRCLQELDGHVNVTHINYFEKLTKLASPLCVSNDRSILYSAMLNIDGKTGAKVFFELIKQDDGTAIIANLLSAPKGGSTNSKAKK